MLMAGTFFLGSCGWLGNECHTCFLEEANLWEFCRSQYDSDEDYENAIQAMEDDGYVCEEGT